MKLYLEYLAGDGVACGWTFEIGCGRQMAKAFTQSSRSEQCWARFCEGRLKVGVLLKQGLAALLDEGDLVDFAESGDAVADALKGGVAEEVHAFVAGGFTDLGAGALF